jgi:hypothetical protein
MKCIVCALALVLTATAAVAQPATPAPAPVLPNPQIETVYVEPMNANYQPIYDRLKRRRVLEDLATFLAPLKLPRKLTVKIDECGGAMTVPYQPQGPVTICYESVERFERLAPEGLVIIGPAIFSDTRNNPGFMSRNDALIGAFVQTALTQVAYAVFDVYQLPVWGREEFAADNVAGFLMLQFGKEVAWRTLTGSAWFLAQSGATGLGDFYSARSPEAQRFFNYVCLAYASDPVLFGFVVKTSNLPEERAKFCAQDYRKLLYSFNATIMPHVDRDVLEKVKTMVDNKQLLRPTE